MAIAQYLSKYLFRIYEVEGIFPTSQCGLPVSNYMNPESVASMVDDTNITLTILRIICIYIRDEFGNRDILPEEAVQSLGTGYMEAEYGTYEYEKNKGVEKWNMNF